MFIDVFDLLSVAENGVCDGAAVGGSADGSYRLVLEEERSHSARCR